MKFEARPGSVGSVGWVSAARDGAAWIPLAIPRVTQRFASVATMLGYGREGRPNPTYALRKAVVDARNVN